MLTDTKLHDLKPQNQLYKVPDPDGLYVAGWIGFLPVQPFHQRSSGDADVWTVDGAHGATSQGV